MSTRGHRGRTSFHAGAAAEEQVAAHYQNLGAQILERRHQTPEGEIDLIILQNDLLIFVEVKKRKNNALFGSPISERQWQRLANGALHYMMERQSRTGVQPICRFDVALVGPDGSVQIIENARSFDEH